MKQRIGLDRELKLRWLDIGASLAQSERGRLALRAQLMEALTKDIPAHYVRVKTCTVLIRTWLTVPPDQTELRDRAFRLMPVLAPDQRLLLHWGMLLLAYPFFRDVVSATGRMALSQETVSRSQVSRKIAETWGERTTVKRSVLRVFQSLADWGVLTQNGTDETFRVAMIQQIHDEPLALWTLESMLRANDKALAFSALTQAPENFPFQFNLTLTELIRSGYFETFREGPTLLVGATTVLPSNQPGEMLPMR